VPRCLAETRRHGSRVVPALRSVFGILAHWGTRADQFARPPRGLLEIHTGPDIQSEQLWLPSAA
jgi:hypothetical protein